MPKVTCCVAPSAFPTPPGVTPGLLEHNEDQLKIKEVFAKHNKKIQFYQLLCITKMIFNLKGEEDLNGQQQTAVYL